MPFKFTPLQIPGVVLVEPRVFPDSRGYFLETYKRSEFVAAGIDVSFVQENHSYTTKGVVRGLHFQRPPRSQGKLVRVVEGSVIDVVVDLKADSPTRGKWLSVPLSAENRHQLYLPPWCAHGFYVTSDIAQLIYKVTDEYSPSHEGGIAWDDPDLSIDWPTSSPMLSDRDQAWPGLEAALSQFQTRAD